VSQAQTAIEGKRWDEIDWRRNLVFVSFGCGILGIVLYGVYVVGFRRIFNNIDVFGRKSFRDKLADRPGMITLTKQVFTDVLLIGPFLYWPAFYCMKSACFRKEGDSRSVGELCWAGLRRYKATFVVDNFGMSVFWIPANFVIYALPTPLRMPLTNFVSLVWCIILSVWRGADTEPDTNGTTVAVSPA
jgi:hypothetical protein